MLKTISKSLIPAMAAILTLIIYADAAWIADTQPQASQAQISVQARTMPQAPKSISGKTMDSTDKRAKLPVAETADTVQTSSRRRVWLDFRSENSLSIEDSAVPKSESPSLAKTGNADTVPAQSDAPATAVVEDTAPMGSGPPADGEWESLGVYKIYGYNFLDAAQCGKKVANGITASGEPAVEGVTVAMYKNIPFGTRIYIDGIGERIVQDRGVGPGKVDVAFDTDKECYAVTGKREVWILSEPEMEAAS